MTGPRPACLQVKSDIYTDTLHSAPQDYYDPEIENTLGVVDAKTSGLLDERDVKVGTKVDLFCTKNKVYYEAVVKQVRRPRRAGDHVRILFHFVGWSSCFDEWVPIDRSVQEVLLFEFNLSDRMHSFDDILFQRSHRTAQLAYQSTSARSEGAREMAGTINYRW